MPAVLVRSLVGVALLSWASACDVTVLFTGDNAACATNDNCPPGLSCCDGTCRDKCEPVVNSECQPNTVRCDGDGNLIHCGPTGFVASTESCGAYGCNDLAPAHYCNECAPGTDRCDGLVWETCNNDGTISGRIDCATAFRCTGAGICDAVGGGCSTGSQAVDGTPCDEGVGQDGSLCNSSCIAGVCQPNIPPSCDDANECTAPDICDPAAGCMTTDLPSQTGCGDLCATTCDGVGACVGVAANCSDDNPCTGDICVAGAGCIYSNNTDVCDDLDSCTTMDTCSGGVCVGGLAPICDDADPCTVDQCVSSVGCTNMSVDCSGTAGDCRDANICNPTGADGNCDLFGNLINEGLACTDCVSGPRGCLICFGGTCLDDQPCDGTTDSVACSAAVDCGSAPQCSEISDDCVTLFCVKAGLEHQACSDTEDSTNWGAGMPCQAAVCVGGLGAFGPDSIGDDCYGVGAIGPAVTMRYEFTTANLDGTLFNLWMRNLVDSNWDPGGTEQYDCTLTGVTGVGTLAFSFEENDLNSGRHGTGCEGFDTSGKYCWMAADGDLDQSIFDPIPLDSGPHTLECTIDMNAIAETAGFDGILFTTDLTFEPDDDNRASVCNDNDRTFTDGKCSGNNWGPNVAQIFGNCSQDVSVVDGLTCTTGGDTCCAGACVFGSPPGVCP